eukprot:TRINITY_DN9110_c0_g1_i2.p1 TRINITY_DN9110_c0_g1~~TRINITY_DN9110_c0_g1_i2.p1  ORF type:complete len:276 (-),score=18.25 TRINITY_DN9110_c0_g1_i2:119-946(-)
MNHKSQKDKLGRKQNRKSRRSFSDQTLRDFREAVDAVKLKVDQTLVAQHPDVYVRTKNGQVNSARGVAEVLRHYCAFLEAMQWARCFREDNTKPLFTHERLRSLHKTLMEGLMPDGPFQPAGVYRTVDLETMNKGFVPPPASQVHQLMEDFMTTVNARIGCCTDPIHVASFACHKLVNVHPFEDGNGRISRLLLAVVLYAAGFPVPVSLRSVSKWRKRYFTALHHADSGYLSPLAAVVARLIDETIVGLQSGLVASGVDVVDDDWRVSLNVSDSS